jgi:putative peptidoglycan lipid II flippase
LSKVNQDGEHGDGRASRAVRATGLVSALTLVSRLLGLVREQVFAALLGAGLYADAWNVAFRIPNLLRDLFAEGALSAAFVPTYVKALHEGGREEAHRLARRLLTLLALVMAALVLLGLAFASPLVSLLAPGYAAIPGKSELTVLLTRVMMPFLPLVSLAAVAMGMLNAEERFGFPAFAPAMFNVVSVVWGLGLWTLGVSPGAVALGWALGTLLGGMAQFLVQAPALRATGFRYRPDWAPGDPGLRQIGALMAPATVGLAAVQINIFVNSYFASFEPGAVSWLTYAFRILYLPIGIFGVAAGTVAGAGLARRAAAGDLEGMRSTLRRSLLFLAFLTVPATAGLLVLARPVIRLLYERGRFGLADTEGTAVALVYYAVGLVAYTSVKVLAPAFYALGSPRVPLLASGLAVLTNLVVNVALHERFGFRAVALGTSLGSIANALVLAVVLEGRLGGLLERATYGRLVRMGVATTVMAMALLPLHRYLEGSFVTRTLLGDLVTGLLPVAIGVLIYAGVALQLRLPEAAELIGLARSSMAWRPGRPNP